MRTTLLTTIFIISGLCQLNAQGFRDFKWGTAKRQIISKEGKTTDDGLGFSIDYHNKPISIYKGSIFYVFDNKDHLEGGLYYLSLTKNEQKEIIKTYVDKYGKYSFKHYPSNPSDEFNAYPPYLNIQPLFFSNFGFYDLDVYVWNRLNLNIVLVITENSYNTRIQYFDSKSWEKLQEQRMKELKEFKAKKKHGI